MSKSVTKRVKAQGGTNQQALDAAEKALKEAQDAVSKLRGETTDIIVVLDRSGSMTTIRQDTIGGFNAFLKEQKALPNPATMSLYQFDHEYEAVYERRPLAEAAELTTETFIPRGWTALLDAIGRTIVRAEATPGHRKVVVIITDGQENSSKEFTNDKIRELIKSKEALGWQFVYLGANQDAFSVASQFGFNYRNTMTVAANAAGTKAMYGAMGQTLSNYRDGTVVNMSFSDEDREVQAKAGANPTTTPPATP